MSGFGLDPKLRMRMFFKDCFPRRGGDAREAVCTRGLWTCVGLWTVGTCEAVCTHGLGHVWGWCTHGLGAHVDCVHAWAVDMSCRGREEPGAAELGCQPRWPLPALLRAWPVL